MGKFLVFLHSGDFRGLIERLNENENLVTVHFDTSREALRVSNARYRFAVGSPGGVGEQILECLPQVAKEPYRFHQFFQ